MKRLFKLVDTLNLWLWYAASALLVLIAVSVFYEVICRYVFSHSNVWVGECSGYLFAFIAFLGAPYVYSKGGMTAVGMLTDKMKPKAKFVVTLIGIVISMVFLVLLFLKSGQLMLLSLRMHWKSASALSFPLWIPQLSIPLGALLMCLTGIVMFLRTCVEWHEGKRSAEVGEPGKEV